MAMGRLAGRRWWWVAAVVLLVAIGAGVWLRSYLRQREVRQWDLYLRDGFRYLPLREAQEQVLLLERAYGSGVPPLFVGYYRVLAEMHFCNGDPRSSLRWFDRAWAGDAAVRQSEVGLRAYLAAMAGDVEYIEALASEAPHGANRDTAAVLDAARLMARRQLGQLVNTPGGSADRRDGPAGADPGWVAVLRMEALVRLGRLREAVQQFDQMKVDRLTPQWWPLVVLTHRWGWIALAGGDQEAAKELLRASLRIGEVWPTENQRVLRAEAEAILQVLAQTQPATQP